MAAAKTTRLTAVAMGVFIAAAAAKAVVSLIRIITTTAPDFVYYYEAAGEVTRRVSNPIHLLPPASLLIFAPLRLIPFDLAQGIWVTLSFLCLIGVVWRVTGMVGLRDPLVRWTLVALGYLSFPTQFTLGMGQINLIVLYLFVVSVAEEIRHRSVFAGGVFALAILLKPEIGLLAPVFLLTRRWRILGSLAVFLGGVIAVSLPVFGVDAYGEYASRMNVALGSWRDVGIYYNQGLSGLVARMGGDSTLYFILSVLVIVITLFIAGKRDIRFPSALWLAIPVFLLIEPIAWQHHFVFLLPVYVLLAKRISSLKIHVWLGISFVLISMNFAAPAFLDTMPLGWLVSSHATVGNLLVWILAMAYI